ncbi:hypothetical protein GDO81_007976 [Engystomops pustulosus]|uniref:Uncharacterized protein n=1 Tax=Engystomops pustulosus TaxID=76066 RepID=A0AAV7CD76_ENGPU|nr:hypothetical protein GDO81_007976 [Engystomops pustulosus]
MSLSSSRVIEDLPYPLSHPPVWEITTFNGQGQNSPVKRAQVLHHFYRHKVQILCLQETHFKGSLSPGDPF